MTLSYHIWKVGSYLPQVSCDLQLVNRKVLCKYHSFPFHGASFATYVPVMISMIPTLFFILF